MEERYPPLASTSAISPAHRIQPTNEASVAESDSHTKRSVNKRKTRKRRVKRPPDCTCPRELPDFASNDTSIRICSAITRFDKPCTHIVIGGEKGKVWRLWCSLHENEEQSLRAGFKTCTEALKHTHKSDAANKLPKNLSTNSIPVFPSVSSSTVPGTLCDTIAGCSDLAVLEKWERIIRLGWENSTRGLKYWKYYWLHFCVGGTGFDIVTPPLTADGDGKETKAVWAPDRKWNENYRVHMPHPGEPGTLAAMGTLEEYRMLVEANRRFRVVLDEIIARAHYLILRSEDALWLIDEKICDDQREEDTDEEEDNRRYKLVRKLGTSRPADKLEQEYAPSVPHPKSIPPPSHPLSSSYLEPGLDISSIPSWSPSSPTTFHLHDPASESYVSDPVAAIEVYLRNELLEILSLTGSHASFIEDGRKARERVRIIECLFRRLVVADGELLVRGWWGGFEHVLRFFESASACPLSSLQRLYEALKKTTIQSLKVAVTDAFRAIRWEESGAGDTEDGDAGVGVQVLGGWVYRYDMNTELGIREWSHLYDMCGCPGCALRICSSFQEFVRLRRLTVISQGNQVPPYYYWGTPTESDANKIFKTLDILNCNEEGGKSSTVIKPLSKNNQVEYTEITERNCMFIKLSVSHPFSRKIMSALLSRFTVIIRPRLQSSEVPTFPIPPPSTLWMTRMRHAVTRDQLRTTRWAIGPLFGSTQESVLAVLDSFDTPEKEQGMDDFTDVFELLILDGFGRNGEGSGKTYTEYMWREYQFFEAVVGDAILHACELESTEKAIEWVGHVSFESLELRGAASGVRVDGVLDRKEAGKGGFESLRDDTLAFKLSRSLFR